MLTVIIQADAKPGAGDFALAKMRTALRGSLPKTLFKPTPHGGLFASAVGPAIFLLIVGGFWLLIENYSASQTGAGAVRGEVAALKQ